MAQAKADELAAAIEGAGGEQMRNQKALVDQMQKVQTLQVCFSAARLAAAHRCRPCSANRVNELNLSEATQQQAYLMGIHRHLRRWQKPTTSGHAASACILCLADGPGRQYCARHCGACDPSLCRAPQDIAAKDAEKARAEVKAAAAAKAAAKLRTDGVKGEAERERLAAELEGMMAKFEVPSYTFSPGHCLVRPSSSGCRAFSRSHAALCTALTCTLDIYLVLVSRNSLVRRKCHAAHVNVFWAAPSCRGPDRV